MLMLISCVPLCAAAHHLYNVCLVRHRFDEKKHIIQVVYRVNIACMFVCPLSFKSFLDSVFHERPSSHPICGT